MKLLTILFLSLSYTSGIHGAVDPGKKSYNTINENGAHIVQETIDYEQDKVVTITTPQHHDLDYTKMVFDKESNHMMEVFLDKKECVVNYQPILPVSPSKGFENLKAAEAENTYESPIDAQGKFVEKVFLDIYVDPNPIPFASLPAKFQNHCPSDFTVYKAHMVDPQRISPEDPMDLGRNVTSLSDAYDYQEPSSGRVKRSCRMSNGNTISGCHEVTQICDSGCSMSNTRYKCEPRNGRRSCAYILWDCGPTIRNNGCLKHLNSGTNFCDVCCINKWCGNMMPKCFT